MSPGRGHLQEERGHGLDAQAVLSLAVRTVPYLGPVLRELRPLVPILLPIVLFGVPISMLLTDLVMNRMLAGNPLTPFEAAILFVESAEFVEVEKLLPAQQALLRDRLFLAGFVTLVVSTPIILWVANLSIRLRQQINQMLRVQMMGRVAHLPMH